MAIYNNREVSVVGPTYFQSLPETVRIIHQDQSQESVPLSQVKLTEDEKKALVKAYPSRFESAYIATDEDVKAVRAGVAPPSDPAYKEQAEARARQEQAEKINQQNIDAAKKSADKSIKEDK